MRRPSTRLAALALLAALAAPARAGADIITLNATDSGWYQSNGSHTAAVQNYIVGEFAPAPFEPLEYRNFFVFQLPALAPGEVIVSATLRAFNPASGYQSPGPFETYNVRDVAFGVAQLTASHGAGDPEGQAIFADLGAAALYGARDYSAADNGQVTEIALSAAAVADLNARLGTAFALGGHVTTLDLGGASEFIFGASTGGPEDRQLVLETAVPEPGPAALAGAGLAGLLAYARRRRKAAPA